jgi:hypothetical protein
VRRRGDGQRHDHRKARLSPVYHLGFVHLMVAVVWWQWLVAAALFLAIAGAGFSFLRGVGRAVPRERVVPEDVEELDVFFVCGECGTEFRVTRLGEVQIPRHCGEPMKVVRRPRAGSAGV